jgi:hypothetical protein
MACLWCGSVTNNEGLHSPKAIVFIFDSRSQKLNSLKRIIYCEIELSPEEVTEFLKATNRVENTLNVGSTKNLGGLKWTN